MEKLIRFCFKRMGSMNKLVNYVVTYGCSRVLLVKFYVIGKALSSNFKQSTNDHLRELVPKFIRSSIISQEKLFLRYMQPHPIEVSAVSRNVK